jgi:hypothetical protein
MNHLGMTKMKTNLVQIHGQQAFTTSLIIADSCPTERKGIEFKRTNKSIVDLVRKHKAHFEEHGRVDFESLPLETNGGIQITEIAHLYVLCAVS